MNTRRLLSRLGALGLLAGVPLILTACGASKPPGSKTGTSTGAAQGSRFPGVNAAYRFSACMRDHGVINFQDPKVQTNGDHVQVAIHVDPAITDSPAFKSAQSACAHILPGPGNAATVAQQHARREAMLAFAQCMRQHGFSRFPDPTGQGQLTLAMIRQAGIDLQQPAVRPAAYGCTPVTHGLLTRANINQALANPQASGGGG
jgi:hypothetical protein